MKSLSTPIIALIICGVLPFAEGFCAVPKELDIISGEGSEQNDNTRIENAFDGLEGTTIKECYFNNKNEPKEARFKINREAEVQSVLLLGRAEKRTWNMVGTVIEVCTGISDCKPCGTVSATPPAGEYADVQCAKGAQGDTIRLTSTSTTRYLQICEIQVLGFGIPKDLNILSGEGSERNDNTRIQNAFDGNEGTTIKECYFNDKNEPKEARFKINTAVVEIVKLLGRAEVGRRNWNMVDTVVEVCTGISDCKPCGTVTATPPMGEYAEVECAEGAQGDTIRLTSTSKTRYLQICEIKVLGLAQ